MFWDGPALLLALVAVAGCATYLFLVKHRKQSQKRRNVQLPSTDNMASAKIETPADSTTPPRAEPAEHEGSEPCVGTGAEPLASSRQTCDVSETNETILLEKKPAHPQEPAGREGEREFTKVAAVGMLDIGQEIIPSPVESHRESQIAGESPAEQPAESALESDAGGPAVPVEERQPPAGEESSTNRFQKAETADIEDDEPCPVDESEHEIAEEDHHAQRSATPAQAEPVPDQPIPEPPPEPQTGKVGASSEQETSAQGDLPDTRRGEDLKGQGHIAQETRAEGQAKKSAGAKPPVRGPTADDGSAAGSERKPDAATKQTLEPTPEQAPKKTRNAKHRKKKEHRQQPIRTRAKGSGDEERLIAEVPEITGDRERHRPSRPPLPSRYHPPSQEPVTVPQPSRKQPPMQQARQRSFDLTLRLLFNRSGHFRVGILPQRGNDAPEEIALGPEGNSHTVAAVHDGFYEDVYPENLSALLVDGISWEGRTESDVLGSWTLSGRDLYVLTTHKDLHGFAQATRLKIGREHIVLCRNSLLALVEPILYQIGCAGFIKLDESQGAPAGWTAIRGAHSERKVIQGIVPTNAVRVETGPEILSILQPEPDLEIDLQGGIYLQQSTWLHGFPPRICVSGDIQPEIEVFIDGNRAVVEADGSFTNQGYDAVGEHAVSIPVANTSRIYRITEGKEDWPPWDAHGLACGQLCGPLLLASDASATLRAVVVPSSNSVILGAEPGDIAYCPRIQGPKQVGCVTFHAVWAIPFDAFGCDKKTTTIRLLSARQLVKVHRRKFTGKEAARVIAWSAAILNASRKGLLVDTSDPHAPVLWKEYKSQARSLWRMLKK